MQSERVKLFVRKLLEGDPITLFNRILFDPPHSYSWLNRKMDEWIPPAKDLQKTPKEPPVVEDKAGQQGWDDVLDSSSEEGNEGLEHFWQDPRIDAAGKDRTESHIPVTEEDYEYFRSNLRRMLGIKEVVKPEPDSSSGVYSSQDAEKEQANPEIEKSDAGTVSTDPKYNACPLFYEGFCRVDGRLCPYDSSNFESCGKYTYGKNMKPELMKIQLGQEETGVSGAGPYGDA